MANISENTQSPTWAQGIYQIETSDPVLGGANGIANRQARELAARTQWLKAEIAKAVQSIGSNKTTTDNSLTLKANAATQISAGAGLTGGGTLAAHRTIGLATPSTLSGSTTNWVGNGATGHTHEIARATPTLAGVAKLVNTLNSTATDAALTAAQGKVLAEQITAAISGSLNLRGTLSTRNLNDLFGTANYGVWDNKANANTTTDKNYPTTKAGTLFVLPSAYQGVQLYIPFDQSVLYIRHTTNNSNPTTFSTWRSIGEVVNALNDASTTAALTAAMGKKLNDEKLGNTGNQTLSGRLNINNPDQWEKLRFQTKNGYWRLEGDPKGAVNRRLNFNFVEADDPAKQTYIWFPTLTEGIDENVAYQSWVNSQLSGKLGNTGNQELAGHLVVKYANDWVGVVAHNPTPNKHIFFDGVVNNIPKGGLQIIANDNGAYFVRITATPQGNANQDRRVASVDFHADNIWTNAYGWLHEGFVRAGNGIGQSAKHQIKIGWSADRRLKATVDETDLGGIVTDGVLKPHLDNINNGIHNHVQNILGILNNKTSFGDFAVAKTLNGYQRLPNGLIIQWGRINGTLGSMGGRVTFPIAFPNTCFSAVLSQHSHEGGNGFVLRNNAGDRTGFDYGEDVWNGVGRGRAASASWIAIGG